MLFLKAKDALSCLMAKLESVLFSFSVLLVTNWCCLTSDASHFVILNVSISCLAFIRILFLAKPNLADVLLGFLQFVNKACLALVLSYLISL